MFAEVLFRCPEMFQSFFFAQTIHDVQVCHGLLAKNVEKSRIKTRLQSILTSAFAKTIQDNGRYISVSEFIQMYSPNLHELLTVTCNKANFVGTLDTQG